MSRRTRRLQLLALLILVVGAAAAPGALAAGSSDLRWERVADLPRPSYITSGSGDAPEILDVSPDGLTMTSTVGDTGWISFDISDLEHPQQIAKGDLGGHATSINYTPDGKYFLLTGKGTPNYVVVYDATTFARLRAFTLPGGPDSTAISPDGQYAITGIEDESNTGVPGSLVVFDLDGPPSAWSVRNVAIPPDPAMASATDPQPEFIDIAPDNVAAVTLQENNAVLMLDVASAEIEDIWSTGSSNQLADLDDNESVSLTQPFTAPREPDEIAFTADGQHLLMVNEGEAGDGGRSATVFDRDGNLVWDSGSALEQALAVRGLYPDDRSGDRGSEFEGVDTAVIDGTPWGVVGAERGDALMFLDLTDPAQPRLTQVAATKGTEPEGVLFVPQRRLAISPDAGRPFGWSFFELRDSAEAEAHRQLVSDHPWIGVGGLGTDGAGNLAVLTAGSQQRLLDDRGATIAAAGPSLHLDADNPQPFPEADDVAIDPDKGVAWVVGPAEPLEVFRLDGDGTAFSLPLPDPPGDNRVMPRGIAFAPDGSTLYIASNDVLPAGTMAGVWTLFARNQATGAFRTFEVTIPNGQNVQLRDAAVTPDGDPVLMVQEEGAEAVLLRVPLATATSAGAVEAVPAGSVPDGAYGERGPTGMAIDLRGDLVVVGPSSELSIDPNRFPRTDAEPGSAEGLPSPDNPSLPDVSAPVPARISARVGSRLFVSSTIPSGPWAVSTATAGTVLNGVDGVPSGPAFAGGTVLTSVADGQGGTFVGGNFTTVGGVARSRLAHVLADGTVDPAFNPAPDGKVTSLLRHGSTLFVGGEFTNISGIARTRLAALSTLDGTPVAGFAQPAPETGPRAMAFDAGHLYLGGSFQTLGGAPHHGIGRVDAATGVVDSTWSPQLAGATGSVEALLVGPHGLYMGGEWTGVGLSTQPAVVLVRTSDGTVDTGFALSFQFASAPRFGGFALRGEQLYLTTGNALVGLDSQQRVGRVDAATGAVDLGFRIPPRMVQNVNTAGIAPLLLRGSWLYVGHANGGEFSTRRIARVDAGTGAVDPAWTPALTSPSIDVRTLSSTDGGLFAGGDFTRAGIQRGVGVYDLAANRFLPHLGAGTAIPQRMAAAGGWVYTFGAGALRRLDPATGRPDPGYRLDIIGPVTALSAAQGRLYIGGVSFVDGEPRDGVAAIDGESGELLKGFLPRIDGNVDLVSAHGDTVYVAGDFTAVDGAPRSRLAALDGASGSSRASFQEPAVPGDAVLTDLLAGAGGVYLTGSFTEIGGQPHEGIARLNPVSGAATAGFSPTFSGQPESMSEHGGHLLVSGYLADAPADPLTSSLRALDGLSGATVPGFSPLVPETAAMLSFGTRLLVMSSEIDPTYLSFDVATPENVTPPSLAGLLRQGEPVSCQPGTWENSPTGFTYAWSLDGSPVAGEVAATYTPRDGDLSHDLTCAVRARNQAGTSAAATSAAGSVGLGIPQSTAAPLLSGTPKPGQTLHCSPGSWSRSPSGFAYRWLRDGAELPDTQADRVVAAADGGHQLSCRVTASNAAGESAPQVSNQLSVPAPVPPQVVPTVPTPPTTQPPTTQPPTVSPEAKKKKTTKKAPCKGKRGKKRKACIKKHAGGKKSSAEPSRP